MANDEQRAPWWRGAVLYQIYPRSFADSNGDGVGDLAGIVDRLPYIASLGVDGIWLSPFFRSPMRDFGYDVSDYRDVDPIFGTLADFDALTSAAHDLGLKVVIDQVWSHTSDQHAWFSASSADPDGPYADYYVWADAKPDGTAPNNWQAQFGGPSWTWHPRRRQYYLHQFLASQPDLNFWSPAVRAEIRAIARFWLDRGVDGFRLDVINFLYHDQALTDNPVRPLRRAPPMASLFQRHIHDRSQPETLAFVEDIRALTDAYGDRMLVGEIFDEEPLARQQEYVAGQKRLHTAYSFHLLDARALTPALIAEALSQWTSADAGWPSWSLGNHDVARFPTRLGLAEPRAVRQALACLLAMRGTIFVYQGEELGLPQADVPPDRMRDPFAIAAYTGDAFRDGARTPMPWSQTGAHAGFSSASETWLPLDARHVALSVDVQRDTQDSTLNFTKSLIGLRARTPALRSGACTATADHGPILRIDRTTADARVICLFNLSDTTARMTIAETIAGALIRDGDVALENGGVTLGPRAFVFWECV